MPLAIEMAAAWAKILTPVRMLDRIGSHMDLLTSRRRDLPMRHQSMRAAIEWSYDLLDPELRRLFASLSVFRGGWTAEEAEQVCGASDTLVGLLLLQERSLIVADEGGDETRFRFLVMLREFASEILKASESHDDLRSSHLKVFSGLARKFIPLPDRSRSGAVALAIGART